MSAGRWERCFAGTQDRGCFNHHTLYWAAYQRHLSHMLSRWSMKNAYVNKPHLLPSNKKSKTSKYAILSMSGIIKICPEFDLFWVENREIFLVSTRV